MQKIRSFILGKINRSNERSTNAIKNIIASFGIKGVSIIVQLLLVPMTISYVNPTQYGIWLTLSSIIGWFSFFDIGFGNGLRNRFAEAKATGDYAKAKAYVSTTYICVGIIFAIVWVLFFCANFFLDWSKMLNAPAQMAEELSIVALIVITFFCLQMVFRLINTVLIADQKPAKSAFFDMTGQVFALIIIFVLTRTTQGSLIYLTLALGCCPILVMLISSLWFYNHEYMQYKPSIGLLDRSIIRDIISLGSKFFVVQIAVTITYQTSNIIIAQICNPHDVAVYNISYKLFGIINMIFIIVNQPFRSAFTESYVLKEFNWIKVAIKKLRQTWLILLFMALILLVCSSYIYKVWVGNMISIPFSLSFLCCVYFLVLSRNSIYGAVMQGTGKIKLLLYSDILCCIFSIPMMIILGLKFGLIGICLTNLIMALPCAIISPVQAKKIIAGTANGIWNK
jgi:O-antigen/teichoic acid export membrane protein